MINYVPFKICLLSAKSTSNFFPWNFEYRKCSSPLFTLSKYRKVSFWTEISRKRRLSVEWIFPCVVLPLSEFESRKGFHKLDSCFSLLAVT